MAASDWWVGDGWRVVGGGFGMVVQGYYAWWEAGVGAMGTGSVPSPRYGRCLLAAYLRGCPGTHNERLWANGN